MYKGSLLLDRPTTVKKEKSYIEMRSQISSVKNKVGRRISRIQSSHTMRPSMVDSQGNLSHLNS